MIRLVQGPDGAMVPDLAETLPGRGVWIDADRMLIEAAIRDKSFYKGLSRSLKTGIGPREAPLELVERIGRLLMERVRSRLGLTNRAGEIVTGFEKTRERLKKGGVALLIEAEDAAYDGRRKLRAFAGEAVEIADILDRTQLGLALGRENVVHAAVNRGGGADALLRDLKRLAAFNGRPLLKMAGNPGSKASSEDFDRPSGRNEE